MILQFRNNNLYFRDFPVYFFRKEDNNFLSLEITSQADESLEFVCIYKTKEICKCSIQKHDAELMIHTSSHKDEVGFMWPCLGRTVWGNSLLTIEGYKTCNAVYKQTTDDPAFAHLDIPAIHHVIDDQCLSVFNDRPCMFCIFPFNGMRYCNISPSLDLRITAVGNDNLRESLNWWYSKNGWHQTEITIEEHVTSRTMADVIFNARKVIEPVCSSRIIEQAHKYQKRLYEKGIPSCIVGSLAMHLHGIKTQVNDIDIILPSRDALDHSVKILPYDQMHKPGIGKWTNRSARLIESGIQADLSWVSNYDWNKSIIKDGLCIATKDTLCIMKMLWEYERQMTCPYFLASKEKNDDRVLTLVRHCNAIVYPFFEESLQQYSMDVFWQMIGMLENAQWYGGKITSSAGLFTTFVKEDSLLIPIIPDSISPSTIVCDQELSDATFLSISGSVVNCETKGITVELPPTEELGLLQCRIK